MKTPRKVLLSQHRHIEPKLERMWTRIAARPAVAPYQLLWRELIWSCRRVWAGLACAWVLIIAVHFATAEPVAQIAGKSAAPPSREEMQALVEQRRMLAQMVEPAAEPADKHKAKPPSPRSERTLKTSVG